MSNESPTVLCDDPTEPLEPPPEAQEGIDYLDLRDDGCKAILDQRGANGLFRVCGKLRGYDASGARTPYCPDHYEKFHVQRHVVHYDRRYMNG